MTGRDTLDSVKGPGSLSSVMVHDWDEGEEVVHVMLLVAGYRMDLSRESGDKLKEEAHVSGGNCCFDLCSEALLAMAARFVQCWVLAH